MKKVYLQALGCRLNEAELEDWARQYRDQGWDLCQEASEADLMVVNTCAVTNEASRKSRQLVNRLKKQNPQSRLLVSGCHSSLYPEQMQQAGVDQTVANSDKDQLVEISLQSLFQQAPEAAIAAEPQPNPDQHSLFDRGRHRAFIKVQDGCRYRCSYCIVTLARGDERSRSIADIVRQIDELQQQGIHEVVISGVHVGGYGSDLDTSLHQLLEQILLQTSMPRIRLASVEPWDLHPQFAELFSNPRLMPHMHLPLQSGADSVLRRMSRRCRTADFKSLCEGFQQQIPGFNVTTDIIVGFPGETDAEWQQTLDFVRQLELGHIHIFSFSPREGTKAAGMAQQIDGAVKKQRHQQLQQLAQQLKQQKLLENVGSEVEVLWENARHEWQGQKFWTGLTPNFQRIICPVDGLERENRILKTRVLGVDDAQQLLLAG